jgi:hypothetical protein
MVLVTKIARIARARRVTTAIRRLCHTVGVHLHLAAIRRVCSKAFGGGELSIDHLRHRLHYRLCRHFR